MTDNLLVRIVAVAIAGGMGAVLRWGVSRFSQEFFTEHWPVGTLLVNILGCFCFGLAYEMLRHQTTDVSLLRLVIMTGFAGGLTTFSTFAFDTFELALASSEQSLTASLLKAAANVCLHLAFGIIALAAGIATGRAS